MHCRGSCPGNELENGTRLNDPLILVSRRHCQGLLFVANGRLLLLKFRAERLRRGVLPTFLLENRAEFREQGVSILSMACAQAIREAKWLIVPSKRRLEKCY